MEDYMQANTNKTDVFHIAESIIFAIRKLLTIQKHTMMKKKITALLVGIFALVASGHAQSLAVTFTATPSIICPGDTVNFTNSTINYPKSWTWYMPGSSISYWIDTIAPGNPPPVTYRFPGTYYVTCVVKNVGGYDSVTIQNCVIVKPSPTAVIMPPSGGICDTSAKGKALDTVFFSLIDTTRGNKYLWAPDTKFDSLTCQTCNHPAAFPTTFPTTTVVYTLTIVGLDGCKAYDYDTVTVGHIVAKISGRDSICTGYSDTLIASGGSTGGSNKNSKNPQTTYLWSNGATTSSIIVSPKVTTGYTVTIISGLGTCTSQSSIEVYVFPKPNFQLTFSLDSICNPGTITDVVSPGGEFPYQYYWYGPPYGLLDTSTFTVSPKVTTTYTLVVRNIGCYMDTIVKVKVNNPPSVYFTGPNDLCQGSEATLTAHGGLQYHWDNGKTTSSINITAVVTKTYTVQVRSGMCFKDTSFTVNVDTMPTFKFKGDTSICQGQSTTIYAYNPKAYGYQYLWNTGATNDNIVTGQLFGSQVYYLTIDKGACSKDSSTITVKVYPPPRPSLYPIDTIVCEYDSVPLTATGGNYFVWTPDPGSLNHYLAYPSNDTDINKAAPPVTTVYKVKVCTWGCCTGDTGEPKSPTATVNIIPSVQGYSVCCSETVSGGTPVQLNATYDSGPYYIEGWSPSTGLSCVTCANPTATDFVTTTYVVTFADDNGCTVKDSVTIDILNCNVFVPDVFSPNGDGVNDYLYVRSECIKNMDFSVFDRWGNKIFETQDQNAPWDGTYKGKKMEAGTYMWYLTALLSDGTHVTKSGNVTIVR